ncbi:MAG: hypothetical protein ABII93_01565 [Chrysiogenia bacterium]
MRITLILFNSTVGFAGQGIEQTPAKDSRHPVSILILLGERFGDAYIPLQQEIEAKVWTMKRAGIEAEYRGYY